MTIITVIFNHFMGDRPMGPETRSAFLASMHLSMVIFSSLCVVGILFSIGRLKPASPKDDAL
jgi:hypothetical protein